jgi:hypothetical protein
MTRNPKRIQRQRTKGWRLPDGAVCVTRGTRWGNPFRVGDPSVPDARTAVAYFSMWLDGRDFLQIGMSGEDGAELRAAAKELRGKALACWCPLPTEPHEPDMCHAAVLLEIANG